MIESEIDATEGFINLAIAQKQLMLSQASLMYSLPSVFQIFSLPAKAENGSAPPAVYGR